MLSEVTLLMEEELAQYMSKKGFAEIFVRTLQGKCSEIAKCMIRNASPDKAEKIANIATQVVNIPFSGEGSVSISKLDLLRSFDTQVVRRELASVARNQKRNSKVLHDMSLDIKNIFSATKSIQSIGWLSSALSACNLGATIVSSVIIGKKLNKIDEKLDRIDAEIKAVDQKLDLIIGQISVLDRKLDSINGQVEEANRRLARLEDKLDKSMHAQFVHAIKVPCGRIKRTYAELNDLICRKEEITRRDISDFIGMCCGGIQSIMDTQFDYTIWKWDMLSLLSDILPAMTDMIIYYHKHFYNRNTVEGPLCQSWMEVYDKLSNESFLNDIRQYLFLEKNMHNKEMHEIVDCIQMIVMGYKYSIKQVLDDIPKCESVADYCEFIDYSNATTFRLAQKLMTEVKEICGEEETEKMIEPIKQMYMLADIHNSQED